MLFDIPRSLRLLMRCSRITRSSLFILTLGSVAPSAHAQIDFGALLSAAGRASKDLPQLQAQAALQVNPVLLTLSPQYPATVKITNPLDTSVTVTCALRFVYPQVDSTGAIVADSLGAPAIAASHDASRWVHGVPSELVLAAHEIRILTLAVRIPPHTHDGEYWTALILTERQVSLPSITVPGFTFAPRDIQTLMPVMYQQHVGPMALRIGTPVVTVVGDSLVRACVPMRHTGIAHVDGNIRISLRTGVAGVDTVMNTPVSVYEVLTPCWTFPLGTVSPGTYDVEVIATATNTPDLLAGATPTPIRVSMPFSLTQDSRRAAKAARAHRDSLYTSVTLVPAHGPLPDQLAAEVHNAIQRGQTPIMDVGATWCGPCHDLDHALQLSALQSAVRGMYVMHVDLDQWQPALGALGLSINHVPLVVTLDRTGKPTTQYLTQTIDCQPSESVEAAVQRGAAAGVVAYLSAAREAWGAMAH